MVGNPSETDFDDSDTNDFGEFDDEFDEYEDDVTSDMEENKLFAHTGFSNSQTVNKTFLSSWKKHTGEHISDNGHYITMMAQSVIILKRHMKTCNKEKLNTN